MNSHIKMQGSYRETSRNLQYGLHKDESGPTKNPLNTSTAGSQGEGSLIKIELKRSYSYLSKIFIFYY